MINETSGNPSKEILPDMSAQRSVNTPQVFEGNSEVHNNEIGEATKAAILEWASSLPKSDLPLLDIASGNGIEAAFLDSQGFPTISQDPSQKYMEHSFHKNNHRIGVAEQLPDLDESIRGILFKDALIFLSPEQRKKAFEEAYRVLIKSGSMLLITEYSSAYRALYVPNSSKYPQTLSSADLNNSYLTFIREIERMKADNHFFSIQYKADPESITKMAQAAGLTCTRSERFSFKSPLAQENRWTPRETLLMVFKKQD